MDNELFKLCKEVRDRTEWRLLTVGSRFYVAKPAIQGKRRVELYDKYKILPIEEILNDYGGEAMDEDKDSFIPIYTSDYLLAKLPEWIGKYGDMQMSRGYMKGSTGAFRFFYGRDGQEASIEGTGTTAVSALLKLTIALSEAGELK